MVNILMQVSVIPLYSGDWTCFISVPIVTHKVSIDFDIHSVLPWTQCKDGKFVCLFVCFFVYQLVYLLLGHDASFGYIEAVNLTQHDTLMARRLGYMASSMFLHKNPDLVGMLLVNSLQKDLSCPDVMRVTN